MYNPTILLTNNNPDSVFDFVVNFITNNLGLDFLYQELGQLDQEGNNIILLALQLKKEKIVAKLISLGQKMDKEFLIKFLSQSNGSNENILSLLAQNPLNDSIHDFLELFLDHIDNQLDVNSDAQR
jgi:hypothetical protein